MLLRLVPQIAEHVLALALRAGIEAQHVRRLVVQHSFAAPHRMLPHWPWPLAVRAFGTLELSSRGEVARPAGKAQKRPLMLLKALLAGGEGGKSLAALAVQLWPEVDDPKASLNVTLHRLRKLLGDDKVVLVVGGMVMLAGERIWSDVRALGELCEQVEAWSGTRGDAHAAQELAELLLDLYRGPFCAEDEEPWLLAARDAWRRRFLAAVARLGEVLEGAAAWPAAQQLYARALEAEPLAETNYRGLMRCAHAQHDPSAAFSAYRRCKEILSIVLGRAPSAETEALAGTLGFRERRAA
jgi:DNA-binding SARP family transcriptional activator